MMRRPGPAASLRIATAAYRFRESLLALPTLILVGGIVLAEVTAYLDDIVGVDRSLLLTVEMNSNGATWLLSTVAGAMITTAGVVFSLTVVSLQLASSQFSPRVMRSFIRDRLSQSVIGLLVATFVFCVLTLRHISGQGTDNAPRISLTVAIVLTVATVLLIIAYLNRLAHGLQVGQVVRNIAVEADDVVKTLTRQVREERSASSVPATPESGAQLAVHAQRDGWVTQAPSKFILAVLPRATVVRLETRTGAYIHQGEVLMTVWPVPDDDARVAAKLLSTVEIADVRTMQQDVDFGIRQLVDIALRALSAAINDPTTATEVVLRLGSLLRKLLVSPAPPSAVAGPGERVLLRPWDLSHDESIAHAFDQIRRSAVRQPLVVATLIRVLLMLIHHVRTTDHDEYIAALQHQIQLVMEAMTAEPSLHPADLARLQEIASDAVADPAEHDVN